MVIGCEVDCKVARCQNVCARKARVRESILNRIKTTEQKSVHIARETPRRHDQESTTSRRHLVAPDTPASVVR